MEFMRDDSFMRLLMGPFGSGKSVGCVQEIVKRASLQNPNEDKVRRTRFAVVRNTYRQLSDTTMRTFFDWYPDRVWGVRKVKDEEFNMNFKLEDGTTVECEIMFRALDRPDQVGNLLSLELTGAWFNEMRDIPKEIWEAMQGRVGRFPSRSEGGATWYGQWGDTNPPDTDHWIYKLFEEQRPDNAKAFYQPSGLSEKAENIPNLPVDYYKNMSKGKDQDYIKVYVHGEYGMVREGKPVYPEYSDPVHCQEVEYNPRLGLIRGWDFGRTPTCVYAQITHRGQLRILDELTSEGMGIEVFAKEALDYTKRNFPNATIERDIGDPSGDFGNDVTETTPFSILWDAGVNIEKGRQDLDVRLSSVKSRLGTMIDGKPALLLDPRCKTLRKGFIGGYCYKRMQISGERYQDKPDKHGPYSHPQDCVQYICTLMFDGYSGREVKPVRVVGGFN
jgi:hypothetical protein